MRIFLVLIWLVVCASHVDIGFAQTVDDIGDEATIKSFFDEAKLLQKNVDVPADVESGLAMHKRLAEAGYAASMYELGKAYYYGEGVGKDIARSARYFENSVGAGNSDAMVWFGRVQLETDGGSERAYYILRVAVTLEIAGAEFRLGKGHVDESFGDLSDPAAGLEILRRLAASGDSSATYVLGIALRNGGDFEADPVEARRLFLMLADQGHGKSSERLGEMMSLGEGGPVDLEAAVDQFNLAWHNGRPNAALKLADTLVAAQRSSEARTILEIAVVDGSDDARLELALGDVNARFGTASDPDYGSAELREMTRPPTKRVADRLAKYALNNVLPVEVDLDLVVGTLEAEASNGDASAALRLIRLYRQRPDLFLDAVARRKAALDDFGSLISSSEYVREEIRLIGETTDGSFAGRIIANVLKDADPDDIQRGLFIAFQADRNAYVYLVQNLLRERGIYKGRLNGLADQATIRAIMNFCAQHNFTDLCSAGPLGKEAARALSSALAHGA